MHSERLKTQIEELKALLKNMRLERSGLMNEILIGQERLETIRTQVNMFQECKTETIDDIEEIRGEREALECKIGKLKKEIDNLNTGCLVMQDEYSNLVRDFDVLKTKIKDSEDRKQGLQSDIDSLSECKIDLVTKQDKIKLDIGKKEKEFSNLEGKIIKLDEFEEDLKKYEVTLKQRERLLNLREKRLNKFKKELFIKKSKHG